MRESVMAETETVEAEAQAVDKSRLSESHSENVPGIIPGREIRRIIIDYPSGELVLQVRAAHAAIRDGRPADGLSVLSYGLHDSDPSKVFAVKWNKDSVRVYPQKTGRAS